MNLHLCPHCASTLAADGVSVVCTYCGWRPIYIDDGDYSDWDEDYD